MAYNCWAAPILWETTLWSLDLPVHDAKEWVEMVVPGGVSVKAGKMYRITGHSIPTWERWNGSAWVPADWIAGVDCWSSNLDYYSGGRWSAGCNIRDSTGSWATGDAPDFAFRVYDSEGVIRDGQDHADANIGYFQYWNACSQSFTPQQDYTAAKIALMFNQHDSDRRGYLKVKLERVSMGDPGFIWVEGTEAAYTDSEGFKRTQEGTKEGATGQTPGHLWVEGTNLRYIDSSGDERYITGTQEGATGQTPGHIWIEETKIRYIDSSGAERCFEGT